VSPVRYELGFYIPEDDILHNHRREHLKSYIVLPTAISCRLYTNSDVYICFRALLTPSSSMVPALTCKFVACLDPYVYAISHPRYR
jgi:hypothetical protein